jgi:hypothetical protein
MENKVNVLSEEEQQRLNEELFDDFYEYFTCNKEENVRHEKFARLVVGIKHAIHCTIKDIVKRSFQCC